MNRIIGSLRAEDGKGVVRIEDRFDAEIEELWSAITDPTRVARWFAAVEGDLRPGGTFSTSDQVDGVDTTGRIEVCERPRRLRVTSRETEESYRKGQGVPPFDEVIDVTLTPDGAQTILVVEVGGMPLDKIAFYGVGWQLHAERLAHHLAGREHGDVEARWNELLPRYQELAAEVL